MASVNIESSFALKEKKAYRSHQNKLYQLNEQLKIHQEENVNCKVLSVMMRHLNSFNCFSFGNKSLWTLAIHV